MKVSELIAIMKNVNGALDIVDGNYEDIEETQLDLVWMYDDYHEESRKKLVLRFKTAEDVEREEGDSFNES